MAEKKNIKTDIVLKKIGARIKELRLEKGHSNYETFAYENEISRSQFYRYEKGTDLRMTSLIRVLEALEVNLFEFFNEDFKEKLN